MIVIAHVSDTHLDDDARSVRRTQAVMDYLDGLPHGLDAVLITGDIADHGTASEYQQARRLLRSRHPVLTCPGNHDDRTAFRAHLLDQPPSTEPINQALITDRFVLAACDSTIPGNDAGRLDDTTLGWLTDLLAHTPPDRPVLVAFHHPPVPLHCAYVDDIRQFETQALARLAAQHPNLAGFLCGHAHTAAATTFAGRPLLVAPGVVSTLRLPWEGRAHTDSPMDRDPAPGVAFHVLDDTGGIVTHYRWIHVPEDQAVEQATTPTGRADRDQASMLHSSS